jgi:transcriptional regulator with PAS, ATPase and Fis domain
MREDRVDANTALLRLGATRKQEVRLRDAEALHIRRVLKACDGSRTLAAELLGIPRRTLQRKMTRLKIR